MFKLLKKSSSKTGNDEKGTSDEVSTFSSDTTLKSDGASEHTLTKSDESLKKEKTGLLAKLGAKKDALVEKLEAGTPMGRSNALQKQLKEAGDTDKGPRDNNPTYPVMYVI